jgi:hypothetical protein
MFKRGRAIIPTFLMALKQNRYRNCHNDFDMYRINVPEKHGREAGCCSSLPAEEMQSFWMRNTNISVDMIFINEEQKNSYDSQEH